MSKEIGLGFVAQVGGGICQSQFNFATFFSMAKIAQSNETLRKLKLYPKTQNIRLHSPIPFQFF